MTEANQISIASNGHRTPVRVPRQPATLPRLWFAGVLTALLAACGGGEGDANAVASMAGVTPPAASASGTGTTKSTDADDAAAAAARGEASAVAAAVSNRLPELRPGVESPQDRAGEADKAAALVAAGLLLRSGFEDTVGLTEAVGLRAALRQLTGTDSSGFGFPATLWSAPAGSGSRIVSRVLGDGTDLPLTDFLAASIATVTGRGDATTRALSLESLRWSGARQGIAVEQAELGVEPVMYQRMWVKFDPRTLERARRAGPWQFYLQFWEAEAADFRLRLKLGFDHEGLFWHAKADPMDERHPVWETSLKTVPVVLAAADQPEGWHRIEIWLDRPGSRLMVTVDGVTLVERSTELHGTARAPIHTIRPMMVTSETAPLAGALFDDLEFWSRPPEDASAR